MGDKYAVRVAPSKITLGAAKFKFLVPFYLLLLFVVWNSSSKAPFDGVNIGPVHDITKSKNEAMGAHTILQLKVPFCFIERFLLGH